ncbi:MAG: thiamine pyrophosphate-dependent dehydrogenase E1 component subunit alpha [Spirochaetes bacterium]|nr:thiamine pyrophosphate-dependent dehydrogenase E1 component subunit alpha [Spirochaetota bacterium]
MDYTKDFLVSLYQKLLEIRYVEDSFINPIIDKEILCPVHLYTGEEAIAVGVIANLNDKDKVFGTHRSHGHFLAKGGSLKKLVAEVYCRSTGASKGRGGSMHLIDTKKGFLGAVPIVGGTISLALGAALASHIKNDGTVAVAFFGDGAAGEGVLYESINFASVHKLPLIFICENNLYSTHMPIREIRNSNTIYETAASFNIRAEIEDGNDVLNVYEISNKAINQCREGNGPVFLEFSTYRYRGHVGPDDNIQGTHTDIRPESEIDEWKKRDPINVFENYLKKNGVVDIDELQLINNLVMKLVDEAHAEAKSSPWPAQEELSEHVFK